MLLQRDHLWPEPWRSLEKILLFGVQHVAMGYVIIGSAIYQGA